MTLASASVTQRRSTTPRSCQINSASFSKIWKRTNHKNRTKAVGKYENFRDYRKEIIPQWNNGNLPDCLESISRIFTKECKVLWKMKRRENLHEKENVVTFEVFHSRTIPNKGAFRRKEALSWLKIKLPYKI